MKFEVIIDLNSGYSKKTSLPKEQTKKPTKKKNPKNPIYLSEVVEYSWKGGVGWGEHGEEVSS